MELLKETLSKIRCQDQEWRDKAHARLENLAIPHWALGRLMDLAEDLAGMTGTLQPSTQKKTIVTMAGDHGVVDEGVSLFPKEVTPQMVNNFVSGRAGINALARQAGAKVVVVDMGVASDLSMLEGKILSRKIAHGTENIAKGPAMTREQAVEALEAGIQIALDLAETTDLFGTGDMGIANTTPSSAIVAALTGCSVTEATGRGTGLGDEQLRLKVEVIEKALKINQPDSTDAIDVLAKVGGFEIGGIAGLILGAASLRKPVLIDGFISTAAALLAYTLCPASADFMIAAHASMERGHQISLKHLGKQPLLDLNFRLGEGTGAALAMNLVEAARHVLTEVATFEEAAVSSSEKK